jgi:hypothetical protein
MKIKNNELLIGAISIIVILFLSNYLNKNVTERNGINGMNGKKDLGNFPVPQSSSITQRLSNGIKNIPNFFFPKVDDSPKQIIRNKGGNIKPIYAEKEYVKEDILSANPIGSTEFSFVGSDPEKAWSDDNVSQHPSYHRVKFNDNLTDVGAFFNVNEFHDKTSPQSENHLPDRCFLNNGEVVCEFNDRIQNIPPKLIMDEKYNKVLDSIGKLNTKSDGINGKNERPINGGEFYGDVFASSSNNETFLDLADLPENKNYSF